MRAVLVSPDPATSVALAAVLNQALPGVRLEGSGAAWPDRAELSAWCAGAGLCFLDVAAGPDEAFRRLAWLAADFPQLPLVALIEDHDPDQALQSLRAGALEFLVRPFSAEDSARLVQKVLGPGFAARSVPAEAGHRLIVVLPGKAASGATSLETALDARVFQVLPEDRDALHRALMEGACPAPASKFGKSVAALARALLAKEAPLRKSSGSLLSRLFG